MRIGLFTDVYFPIVNGVTIMVHNLKSGLEKRGHEVHLFCPRYPHHTLAEKNIHTFPILFSGAVIDRLIGIKTDGQITLPLGTRDLDLISKIDVIHSHHLFSVGTHAANYARKFTKPLIFTLHTNFQAIEAVLPFPRFLTHSLLRHNLQVYTRKCTWVICPATYLKRQLTGYYGVTGNLSVINNGLDIEKFQNPHVADVRALRSLYEITANNFVLLYVGRLSGEKNLEFLFRSVAPLGKRDPNLKLLLVGDGLLKNKLAHLAYLLGIERQVIFTGAVAPTQMAAYYHLADIFITASASEVLPVTLIEATASSLPIVAVDAPGVNEVVKNGVNGILTQPTLPALRTALAKAVRNKSLLGRLARGTQLRVQLFSRDIMVKKYADIYKLTTS